MTGFTATWTIRENLFGRIIGGMEQRAGVIVRKAALDIQAQAIRMAPVDTGTLRNSIQARKVRPFAWEVTVGAEYGVYVEWGTRFMAAQPYFRPAITKVQPEFVAAMRTVCHP